MMLTKPRKIMIKRYESSHFASIGNKCLFQFTDRDDRTVYEMIDNYHGVYRHRKTGEILHVEHDNYRDLFDVGAVEVFFIPRLSDRSEAAFDAMVKARSETDLELYLDDLYVHDRTALAKYDPPVFGWAVRHTGTHLMIPNNAQSLFLTVYLSGDAERHKFFLWNGQCLKPSTAGKIEDAICGAGCKLFKKFRNCAYHVKNSTVLSREWQEQIDAELNGHNPDFSKLRPY